MGFMDLEPEEDQTPQDLDDTPDISQEIHQAVNEYTSEILAFKADLYSDMVARNPTQNKMNIGALTTFHALLLQSLAYLIGSLNGNSVPFPTFKSQERKQQFDAIVKHTITMKQMNTDARVLVYNVLFQASKQHPFSFKED